MLFDIIQYLRDIDQIIFHYINEHGIFIYFLLFAVIFSKTAFVILSFLPGDSTLFTSGTLAAMDKLDLMILFILFILATSLADSNNYYIGKTFNKFPIQSRLLKHFLSEQTIEKAHEFFMENNRIAITFSRFFPFTRTMIPFVSGYTGFSYRTFLRYNFLGAVVWTTVWLFSGFLLGKIPWVEANLVLTISLISIIGFGITGIAYLKQVKKKQKVPV